MGFMSKKQRPVPRRRLEQADGARTRLAEGELEAGYAFRRNRTLTGSLSSDVSSVNEYGYHSQLKSSRVHAHHLRRHRRHAFGGLVLTLAISAGLALLIWQSIVSVDISTASGLKDVAIYDQKIAEYLQKHPFERFRFALNTGSLLAYLQAHDMPEVESINSTVNPGDGIGKAQLTLTFRRPVVVWQTAGVTMYVDAKGNSFQRNYYTEPSVRVVDQTGIQSQDNQVLASNRFLSFIGKVVGRMQENGYKVEQMILPANTTRQVQVKLAGVSYPIKLSVDRPVGEQAEDAARAIGFMQQKNITPQYVDVRVSGRAFYQ